MPGRGPVPLDAAVSAGAAEYELRLAARMNEIAAAHPRLGYRRVWSLLRHEGWRVDRNGSSGCGGWRAAGCRPGAVRPRGNARLGASRLLRFEIVEVIVSLPVGCWERPKRRVLAKRYGIGCARFAFHRRPNAL